MKRHLLAVVAALVPAVGTAQLTPSADNHQHLFSPAMRQLIGVQTIDASELVPLLDEARVRRAVLLSVAYLYGSPSRIVEDEYGKVRAENDWTAEQAALYPQRLIAFCGLNPLKDYALAVGWIAPDATQQAIAEGVEGVNGRVRLTIWHEHVNAGLHLLRSVVRERQREDVLRFGAAAGEQLGDGLALRGVPIAVSGMEISNRRSHF